MEFSRDIAGFQVHFSVKGYEKTSHKDMYDQWCICDFILEHDNMTFYENIEDETLLSAEIDEMVETFQQLLKGEIRVVKELSFVEPYFVFMLYPKENERPSSMDTYNYRLHHLSDLFVEWRIYYWEDGALTDNYMTLTLDREDITALVKYLCEVQES